MIKTYSQTCVKRPPKGSTKVAAKGRWLPEVLISTNLKFGKILYGCLRQVGCLKKVTANSGLTVHRIYPHKSAVLTFPVKSTSKVHNLVDFIYFKFILRHKHQHC